jgi:hypothetical protein
LLGRGDGIFAAGAATGFGEEGVAALADSTEGAGEVIAAAAVGFSESSEVGDATGRGDATGVLACAFFAAAPLSFMSDSRSTFGAPSSSLTTRGKGAL